MLLNLYKDVAMGISIKVSHTSNIGLVEKDPTLAYVIETRFTLVDLALGGEPELTKCVLKHKHDPEDYSGKDLALYKTLCHAGQWRKRILVEGIYDNETAIFRVKRWRLVRPIICGNRGGGEIDPTKCLEEGGDQRG